MKRQKLDENVDSTNPKHRQNMQEDMMKHIDGSMLEGGGQILRNATSLSAIVGTPIHIDNIRAKRSKPGLRPQHLAGLQLVSDQLSNGARLEGGHIGSEEIKFYPGAVKKTSIHHGAQQIDISTESEDDRVILADTGTAGSCMLLAQIALPCLLFNNKGKEMPSNTHKYNSIRIELRGGTDAAMAPPIDYFQNILLPTLRRCCQLDATISLQRRGFFPKGNGIAFLDVKPLILGQTLAPITLVDRGNVIKMSIIAFSAGKVKHSVAERMVDAAYKVVLRRIGECKSAGDSGDRHKVDSRNSADKKDGETAEIEYFRQTVYETDKSAFGDGCGILLLAETDTGCLLGSTGLGEKNVKAEVIGQRAADDLLDVLDVESACVDDYLMDQLIVFMALAKGVSRVRGREPTLHTKTAIAVAEILTDATFKCIDIGNGGWEIECHGSGIIV